MSTVAVLSGGLDSTCALALSKAERAISFDYGQRHRRELLAAQDVADHYRIRLEVINLVGLLTGRSALLGSGDVPEGRYDDPSMAATVVPGRNLLFVAAAVGRCDPGDKLVFGVHAGDHPVYPDCRPQFWSAQRVAVRDAYDIAISTPFLGMTKAAALEHGAAARAPVGLTWSCYQGGRRHCGRCGTCVERAEAFYQAGILDPTAYEDADYWRQAVHA